MHSRPWKVLISKRVEKFIENLPEKSQRIVREKLRTLRDDPYPKRGGSKKKLNLPDYELYRMHIARSYTVFYRIIEGERVVKILDMMTIEQAHKMYGRL